MVSPRGGIRTPHTRAEAINHRIDKMNNDFLNLHPRNEEGGACPPVRRNEYMPCLITRRCVSRAEEIPEHEEQAHCTQKSERTARIPPPSERACVLHALPPRNISMTAQRAPEAVRAIRP